MNKAIFYHAGCPVCISAEQQILKMLDKKIVQVDVVHLGTSKGLIDQAEQQGVHSVPALVVEGQVFHINFGASLQDVKGA
ncbi:MAG: thioredoxin family protein [Bermanella sp.]